MTVSPGPGFSRLIVVSYRLPYKIVDKTVEQSSGGLVSAMLGLAQNPNSPQLMRSVVWVGKADSPPPIIPLSKTRILISAWSR